MPRKERGITKELLYPLIDGFVIPGILRAKRWGLSPTEIRKFLAGLETRTSIQVVNALIDAKGVEEAFNVLSGERLLRPIVTSGAPEDEVIKSIEGEYKKLLIRRANRAFLYPKATTAIMAATVILREHEITNLVAIAFGIEQKLPAHTIVNNLFWA